MPPPGCFIIRRRFLFRALNRGATFQRVTGDLMHSDERSGHVPEANLENQASNELTLLVQTERGVAIDNESLHEAGFQESLDSSQLLSPRTERITSRS